MAHGAGLAGLSKHGAPASAPGQPAAGAASAFDNSVLVAIDWVVQSSAKKESNHKW